jgi:hypothetical protein
MIIEDSRYLYGNDFIQMINFLTIVIMELNFVNCLHLVSLYFCSFFNIFFASFILILFARLNSRLDHGPFNLIFCFCIICLNSILKMFLSSSIRIILNEVIEPVNCHSSAISSSIKSSLSSGKYSRGLLNKKLTDTLRRGKSKKS